MAGAKIIHAPHSTWLWSWEWWLQSDIVQYKINKKQYKIDKKKYIKLDRRRD